MESTLAIKVKYGDTLRRFSARVDENNRLDLDIVGLRAKICYIFNFAAGANLILRYVDEDGHLVTLVNDDDLGDVMRQQLKFLRIDVHVSNDIGGKSNAGSSGSATPLKSPPVTNPLQGRDVLVMNSLPEHVREALSKFSLSRDASSSPAVAKVADSISKIRQSHLKDAAGTRSKTGVPEGSITSEAKGPQSPDVISASNASVCSDSEVPLTSPVPDPSLGGNAGKVAVSCSVPEPVREFFSKLSRSKDASSSPVNLADLISLVKQSVVNSLCKPNVTADASSKNGVHEKHTTSENPNVNLADFISLVGQSVLNSLCQPNVAAGSSSKNGVYEKPTTSEVRGPHSPSVDSAFDASHQFEAGNAIRGVVSASDVSRQVEAGNVIRDVMTAAGVGPVDLNFLPCDPYLSLSTNDSRAPPSSAVPCGDRNKGKMSAGDSFLGKGSGASSSFAGPYNSSAQTPALSSGAFFDCPFSVTYTINPGSPPQGNFQIPSFKRSYNQSEAMTGMFHKGVHCDCCGVYPTSGPCFKSKVKENYNLCNICFNEMGNETDYIRMDCPASVCAPRFAYEQTLNIPTLPHVFKKGGILKHAKPKLDSRFILDVNVIDGTMMAPSTAFTKIWQMCNNGTLVWPKGTQLVWIGGAKFSDSHSVDLEVPEDGVPVEKELGIAVDFTAPLSPGQYISYWRMASPSGHKFGQCVWVLIQVDASLKDSFYDSAQGLNLNIPFDVGGSKGRQVIDINVQPIEDVSVSVIQTTGRWISWLPQPQDAVIINVDGSSLGNPGPSGFGGLFRNPDGAWVCGFYGSLGISNSITAELFAIFHGLKIAWHDSHRKLLCYSDCLEVVKLINSVAQPYHAYHGLISSIQDLLSRQWDAKLVHMLRQGNMCADLLAKKGANQGQRIVLLDEVPPDLSLPLAADSAGVAFFRP